MRTDTEIKLLQARQHYRDLLVAQKQAPVTNLRDYEITFVRYWICTDWLKTYHRYHAAGRIHELQESFN